MSNAARDDPCKNSRNFSNSEPSRNSSYSLVESIQDNLDMYDLEPGQVYLDVEIESSENSLEVEYEVGTLGWYEAEDELGLGNDPISFSDSYSIDTEEKFSEDIIPEMLKDSFKDTAIRVEEEIIQECLSPDYDAFE